MSKQKALLFTASRQPLDELQDLLATAGGKSVGQVLQRREAPDPDYYLGQGKILELENKIKKSGASLLVCDDELSPRQERNLEKRLGLPVLDRTALILDIFALHAKSAEGKLQVEIAQIEYNMARMRGLWPHLERLGAGIGTRGPGESQIETDRRLARKRLALLKRRLRFLDQARERGRQTRRTSGAPKIALLGYTNSGKSTLQNLLSHNGRESADQLFHTLDSKTSSYFFRGRRYLLSDTVGIINKLPHTLIAAFRGTLREVTESDLILHVFDASKINEELPAGEEVLSLLDLDEKPRLLVFNKVDLLSQREKERLAKSYPEAVFVSALDGWGQEELCQRIEERLAQEMEPVSLFLPWNETLPYELELLTFARAEEASDRGRLLRAHVPRDKTYLFRDYLVGS